MRGQMKKRIIECTLACILFAGGLMGVIKGLIPNAYWLSFRYLLIGTATYEANEMPLYVHIYGFIMGCMEIVAAIFMFIKKERLKKIVILILFINAIGCIVAILSGDVFAIISLILRIIFILFILTTSENK